MTEFDVLVAGEINPDLILGGDDSPQFGQVEKLVDSAQLVIGSSSVIFACAAARLGLRVAFVGVCAGDLFGRFMLDRMIQHGIDTQRVLVRAEGQTGLSVILTRGDDRAILTFPGLIPALLAGDVRDEDLQQTRHLHIGSYYLQESLQPGLPDLLRRARSLGLTTSLDPNFDPSGRWQGFERLFPWLDVFLPNRVELCALAGTPDVRAALASLAGRAETLAVKLGAQGALGVSGGQVFECLPPPVQVVDTVGAGDCFDAGFLYGFLQGWALPESLRLGCICGGLSTRKAGGVDGQPTLDEAMQWM